MVVVSQCALQVSRPTPGGGRGKFRGLAVRGLQANTQGGVEGSGQEGKGGLQAHTQGVYPSMH